VEAVVLQAIAGQPFRGGHLAGAAKGAGGAKAHVVEENGDHVGRALRRAEHLRLGKDGLRVLGVELDQALILPIGDG
jgi:hypothetical protein